MGDANTVAYAFAQLMLARHGGRGLKRHGDGTARGRRPTSFRSDRPAALPRGTGTIAGPEANKVCSALKERIAAVGGAEVE